MILTAALLTFVHATVTLTSHDEIDVTQLFSEVFFYNCESFIHMVMAKLPVDIIHICVSVLQL